MRRSRTSSPREIDQISDEDRQRVIFAARARMTANAFRHLDYLDARTGALLSGSGLVQDREPPVVISDLELAVLGDADCANRLESPPGPLVCYWSDSPSQRSILDVRDLLLLTDDRGRLAALDYFLHLADSCPQVLAPATKALLARVADSIRSSDSDLWRPHALELHDSLEVDLFLALAAFVQCKALGYQEGANTHAATLLRPSLRTVDSIPLGVLIPSAEQEKMLDLFGDWKECSSSVEEACDKYFGTIGHLPFDAKFGIGRVVEKWEDSLPKEVLWERLWGWADRTRSPLARFHLCVLFLDRPELVPEDQEIALRAEMLGTIREYRGNERTRSGPRPGGCGATWLVITRITSNPRHPASSRRGSPTSPGGWRNVLGRPSGKSRSNLTGSIPASFFGREASRIRPGSCFDRPSCLHHFDSRQSTFLLVGRCRSSARWVRSPEVRRRLNPPPKSIPKSGNL